MIFFFSRLLIKILKKAIYFKIVSLIYFMVLEINILTKFR